MATESSAIVRIARLAEQRPLHQSRGRPEPTLIVRAPALGRRWLLWVVAALCALATAAWIAKSLTSARRPVQGQPMVQPLADDSVVATPLPQVTPAGGQPEPESPKPAAVVSPAEDRESSSPAGRRAQVVGFGILQIGSKPPCEIIIDGRDTGLKTPQRKIRLRRGRHRVGLRNREVGIDERFSVRIRDGRTTKVIRDMSDRL